MQLAEQVQVQTVILDGTNLLVRYDSARVYSARRVPDAWSFEDPAKK